MIHQISIRMFNGSKKLLFDHEQYKRRQGKQKHSRSKQHGSDSKIPYKMNGAIIHTDIMIAVFFFLSFGFQILNGEITTRMPDFPRIVNYVEYSI